MAAVADSKAGKVENDETKEVDEWEARMLAGIRAKYGDQPQGLSEMYNIQFIRGFKAEKEPTTLTMKKYEEMIQTRMSYFVHRSEVDLIVSCRSKFKMHAALDSNPEGSEEYNRIYKFGVLGRSRDGRPVYYERLGKLEPRVLRKFGFAKFMLCHIRMQEEMRAYKEHLSKCRGHRIYKHVVVLDMAGFGMKHASPDIVSQLRKLMSFDSLMFPESLKRLYIVNSPWIFQRAWALVKGILHPVTQERIRLVGTKPKKILAQLTEMIDLNDVPTWLGGKNDSPLPGICSPAFFANIQKRRSEILERAVTNSSIASDIPSSGCYTETFTQSSETSPDTVEKMMESPKKSTISESPGR